MFEAGTLTSDYLKGKKTIAPRLPRRKGNGKQLMLKGCTGHNLRDVDLTLNLRNTDLCRRCVRQRQVIAYQTRHFSQY